MSEELTPKEIVFELDKYIIGQKNAKRAVAVALRNRYRRQQLSEELQNEITPKNIIMIGPTGVGKTEIARRLAKLVNAPFIKVEATKFTEVGYVGRDVESIIRDLMEMSVRMVKEEKTKMVEDKALKLAEDRLLDALAPQKPYKEKQKNQNPMNFLFGEQEEEKFTDEELNNARTKREKTKRLLDLGELEDNMVEIEVEDQGNAGASFIGGMGMEEMGISIQDMFGNMMPKKKVKRHLPVKDARKILQQEEASKLVDMDEVISEAIRRAEQSGIVFLDEIDKVAADQGTKGADVSREGVQRDILPIVEGSTVMTKYGPVKTDYMLFIAAGAFHVSKPSDLIPELQGRFPIRVELDNLTEEDFKLILREPKNSLLKQYTALLGADGVKLEFLDDGIDEMAKVAYQVNASTENIGARRLYTIMEKVLEELLYGAPDPYITEIKVDKAFVSSKLSDLVVNEDLSRFIL